MDDFFSMWTKRTAFAVRIASVDRSASWFPPRSTAVVRSFFRSSFDPPLSIGSKIHPPGRRAIRFQPAGHPSVQTIVRRLRNPTFAGVTARTGEDERTDRRTDGPGRTATRRYACRDDRIRRSIIDPDPDRSLITPGVVGFSVDMLKILVAKKPDVRVNLATIWGLDWI